MYPRQHTRGRRTPARVSWKGRNDAQAQCDRCSHWVQRSTLHEQLEYRGGTAPVGMGIYVCPWCYDVPNPQGALNTVVLQQDPVPVMNPRPDQTTYTLTIPSYAWDALPASSTQPPGTQIYITGIEDDPILSYADGPIWRSYYTGAEIPIPELLPQTQTLIDAMTTPPTYSRTVAINTLMETLVGLPLDVFWMMCAADSQAAGLNWLAPSSFTLSPLGTPSPTFTANSDYQGDGAHGYLRTHWVPSANAVNFTQNSAALGALLVSSGTSDGMVVGAGVPGGSACYVRPRTTSGTVNGRINTTGGSTGVSASTAFGLSVIQRDSSSAISFWRDGASIGTASSTSAPRPGIDFYICAWDNSGATGYTNQKISMVFAGAKMTAAQHLALYQAVKAYMNACNPGIIP